MKSRVIIMGVLIALLLCGVALADCANPQCKSGKNCSSDCGKNQITGKGCGCADKSVTSTANPSVGSQKDKVLASNGCKCKGTVSTGKPCTCGEKTSTTKSCGCRR